MEHPLTDNWFVLRDLTRPNAKHPAYRLLEEKGIEVFTPMRWQLVERKGKRIREEVPLLHDLLFAHTTRTCMDSIVEEISTLQYRYLRGGYRKPMTVGHAEMNRFIRAVHSDDSPRYFLVEELTPAMYGRMIRSRVAHWMATRVVYFLYGFPSETFDSGDPRSVGRRCGGRSCIYSITIMYMDTIFYGNALGGV